MARPALAVIADLDDRLEAGVTYDTDQATARLADASEIVRAFAGTTWLNTAEDAVENVPGAIPGVVASMVERATRNPTGTVQESAGPFSRSFGASASERLFITKAEKSVIRAAVGARTGLRTIRTTRDDPPIDAVYVPVTGSTTEFPWYDTDDPRAFG